VKPIKWFKENQRSFSVTELKFETEYETKENIELSDNLRHRFKRNLTL
jgi:hypothetical protein